MAEGRDPPRNPPGSVQADIRIVDGGTERWNRAPDESRSGGRATGWGRTMWVCWNARTQKRRASLDLITMWNPWNAKPARDGDRGGHGSSSRK